MPMRTRPQARTTRTAERFPRGSEGAAPMSRQGPQRRRQGLRSPRPRRHRARARAPLLRRQSRGPTTALLRPRPGRPLSRRRARSTARRTLRFGTWKHACKQAAPRSWWSSPPWGWCGGRATSDSSLRSCELPSSGQFWTPSQKTQCRCSRCGRPPLQRLLETASPHTQSGSRLQGWAESTRRRPASGACRLAARRASWAGSSWTSFASKRLAKQD
mmetsp:Transcript_20282/g.77883  ORF Transcript_20282/g.77883 Transcript_20282/m.77883 type:complete len:216 (-) Transcript_20282:530-1177(-)